VALLDESDLYLSDSAVEAIVDNVIFFFGLMTM
jgi:hypothetical protein